jgi:hypothetical protein
VEKTRVLTPTIPDRLLECPDPELRAPTGEGATDKDENLFKVDLAMAFKVCKDRNATIAEILSEFERTFAEELDKKD